MDRQVKSCQRRLPDGPIRPAMPFSQCLAAFGSKHIEKHTVMLLGRLAHFCHLESLPGLREKPNNVTRAPSYSGERKQQCEEVRLLFLRLPLCTYMAWAHFFDFVWLQAQQSLTSGGDGGSIMPSGRLRQQPT